MKLSVNVVVQALLLVVQGLNQVQELLPARAKFYTLIALSAIQGVVAVLAHFRNTDGTPQTVAYAPKA